MEEDLDSCIHSMSGVGELYCCSVVQAQTFTVQVLSSALQQHKYASSPNNGKGNLFHTGCLDQWISRFGKVCLCFFL